MKNEYPKAGKEKLVTHDGFQSWVFIYLFIFWLKCPHGEFLSAPVNGGWDVILDKTCIFLSEFCTFSITGHALYYDLYFLR